MLELDKRAALGDRLNDIILVIIVAILLLGVFVGIKSFVEENSETESCRISVLASGIAEIKDVSGINCPKDIQEITLKDLKTTRKHPTKEDRAKRIIAEHLDECWFKMGEGATTPYTRNVLLSNVNYCVVCSEITFDQNAQDELRSINNLRGFLENEKLGSGTYFDYLYVPINPDLTEVFENVNFPAYSTKDKLIVFYSAFKPTAGAKYLYSTFNVLDWNFFAETYKGTVSDISFVHMQPIGALPECTKWINQAPKI